MNPLHSTISTADLCDVQQVSSDRELVQLALAGRQDAIAALLQRLHCVPRILAAHNRLKGHPLDEHELSDAIQDTLLAVWRKLSLFAGQSSLETWVFRFGIGEFMNALRRKARARQRSGTSADAMPDPETPLAAATEGSRDAAILVHEVLDRIDPAEAEVVRQRHFAGLTFDEIAAKLSRSANTIKAIYYRAMRRLQERFGDKEEA